MKKLFTLFCVIALLGCHSQENTEQQSAVADPNVLVVLASSELKDIEPLLPKIEASTGVKLQFNYAGTLGAVERIQAGEAVDVAWLSSNRYATLVPEVKARIIASERTMISPVVLGVKESRAKSLGWEKNKDITWTQIAFAAEQGKFTFGMTNPASSNTGFSALLGLAASLSGKGDAIEERDIDVKKLTAFFNAQRMTSGSSGWLVDSYLKEQEKVDGIINYESTLLQLNQNPALKEKLTLIYPKDGISTADYPIMLINANKRASYDKVVSFLKGIEFQKTMVATTLRHPVNPDVDYPNSKLSILVELPFPSKLTTVDAILLAYDNQFRLPTDSTFVLDKSGSMEGQRMADLKLALNALAGQDASISGRFSKFHNRERISLLTFNNEVNDIETFNMVSNTQDNLATTSKLSSSIANINADGGTAIFSAVQSAYMSAANRRDQDRERFYSIVLMTDGLNNSGISLDDFAVWYQSLPASQKGIKIFPILFGEADSNDLSKLALLSGGKLFDSRKLGLKAIFKEIRGYQ